MRVVLQLMIALAFIASGVVFGAYNPEHVILDFHVFRIEATLGVAVLGATLIGAFFGGIVVAAGVAWPLRLRLRKALAGSNGKPPDGSRTDRA